jgi:hypothetical protein
MSSHTILLRYILLLVSHLRLDPQSGCFPQVFPPPLLKNAIANYVNL